MKNSCCPLSTSRQSDCELYIFLPYCPERKTSMGINPRKAINPRKQEKNAPFLSILPRAENKHGLEMLKTKIKRETNHNAFLPYCYRRTQNTEHWTVDTVPRKVL